MQAAPVLLEKMEQENDIGLLVAYASSLGKLRLKAAVPNILEILPTVQSTDTRMELAFALALLVGKEHTFIQLHRQSKIDPGTSISQAMQSIRKKSPVFQDQGTELSKHLDESAEAFARQDLDCGLDNLLTFLRLFPLDQLGTECKLILQECIPRLEEFGIDRMEYLLLMLHVLNLDDFPCWDGG